MNSILKRKDRFLLVEYVWLFSFFIFLGMFLGAFQYFTFDTEMIARRKATTIATYPHVFIHVVSGMFWLLSGFFQFTSTFQRNLNWHRLNGYFYYVNALLCIFTLFIIGFILQEKAPFSTGSLPMSIYSLICLVIGFIHIKQKNIKDHRAWMLRSMHMPMVMVLDRFIPGMSFYWFIPYLDIFYTKTIIFIVIELIIFKKLNINLMAAKNGYLKGIISLVLLGVLFHSAYITCWIEYKYVNRNLPGENKNQLIEHGLEHVKPKK